MVIVPAAPRNAQRPRRHANDEPDDANQGSPASGGVSMRHGPDPSHESSAGRKTGYGQHREPRPHRSASHLAPTTMCRWTLRASPGADHDDACARPGRSGNLPCSTTRGARTFHYAHTRSLTTHEPSLLTTSPEAVHASLVTSHHTLEPEHSLPNSLRRPLTCLETVVRNSPIPFNSTKIHRYRTIHHASLYDFSSIPTVPEWCPRPDSNRHGRSLGILSPLCLPIPPRGPRRGCVRCVRPSSGDAGP